MEDPARLDQLEGVIGGFLNVVLGLVAAVAVVMIVVAGFNYLMAGADKEGTARAKNTLTFALVGLVLAASAYMIISIIGSFLGISNLGIFNICFASGCPT